MASGSKKKRIRYKVPTFIKFYSIYQYDRLKFRKLLNIWLKTPEGQSRTRNTVIEKQREILEQCWVLDENGNKQRDSDTLHIFRYRTLHKILEIIAQTLIKEYGIQDKNSIEYLFRRTNIKIYKSSISKPQAELANTAYNDIKSRILVHLKLLRSLRKSIDVEMAVNEVLILFPDLKTAKI